MKSWSMKEIKRLNFRDIHNKRKGYRQISITDAMNDLMRPGRITLVIAGSGEGKTYTATSMIDVLSRQGRRIYHNMPLFTERKNVHRFTTLSGLLRTACKSDLKEQSTTILDEANMKLSGAKGGTSTKLRSTKEYISNFGRKISNTNYITIFQNETQPAPAFREDGELHAIIRKPRIKAMSIHYEKGRLKGQTRTIYGIPLPPDDMTVYSHGPAPFLIDIDMTELDDWTAKPLEKLKPTPQNWRRQIIKYLDHVENMKDKVPDKRDSGKEIMKEIIMQALAREEEIPPNNELAELCNMKKSSVAPTKSVILSELRGER